MIACISLPYIAILASEMQIDYVRYLQSKVPVDDRALNPDVLATFERTLRSSAKQDVLRVVDIGAGIGAMLFRLLKIKGVFDKYGAVEYTLVDVKEDVLMKARELLLRISNESDERRISVAKGKDRMPLINDGNSVHHSGLQETIEQALPKIEDVTVPGTTPLYVHFAHEDALTFLLKNAGKFDVAISAAFLDLYSLDVIIPIVRESFDSSSAIKGFYFPITFDGITSFSPVDQNLVDDWDTIIEFFHVSMSTGVVGGQKIPRAHSGRSLAAAIQQAGGRVSAIGSSVWTVQSDVKSGAYSEDEGYFFKCIFQFIKSVESEELYDKVPRNRVEVVFDAMSRLISSGNMRYEAHNVDVCGVF